MNSMVTNIFSSVLLYPTIPLVCALFFLLLYVIYLHHKMHRFTRGETGASLETLIRTCVDSVREIEAKNELISQHALSLDERVSSAIRNVQTMRYKAFEANGSNQSFSVALVNERGHGVILTSLHARDRISTFAKPLHNYSSSYELTEEEREVIEASKKEHKSR